MKQQKTTVMRILEKERIPYNSYSYEFQDEHISGNDVAKQLKQDPNRVFKTLVCISHSNQHYVFVIPVNKELDLKLAAKVSHEKKMEMLPMKDLLPTTGYIHGGCSPIGMKKKFPTCFAEECLVYDTIIFSAGKRGSQVEVSTKEVLSFLNATTDNITK